MAIVAASVSKTETATRFDGAAPAMAMFIDLSREWPGFM